MTILSRIKSPADLRHLPLEELKTLAAEMRAFLIETCSVTGGHTVAATGTIDSQGDVGDVGGVAQKTVAVENAGASIFLVPPQEYKAALSKIRPGLQVYAVSTLDQALQVLKAHGGKVPPAPVATSPTVPLTPAAG